MSDHKDHKKVIHVKDLVIKADNVHIEPQHHRPRRDPFFGRWMGRDDEAYKESADKQDDHYEETEEDKKGKGPSSWI
ncbi:hypothetical protein GCM10007063_17020 [Lentibacillus kapialis]|uniref:Uncharacterized protein n=1 Tax=Lentibacillus kapialis TaxID=340214 RepID=A0A917PWX1_9BACI|nr:hypothetical protein [Lentibacillus kapialis]GGJ95096.1 hypothetical protein GCM10007063_17020 [Lentibacillus kapialis]